MVIEVSEHNPMNYLKVLGLLVDSNNDLERRLAALEPKPVVEDKCPRCSSVNRAIRKEVYSDSSHYDFRTCPHFWHDESKPVQADPNQLDLPLPPVVCKCKRPSHRIGSKVCLACNEAIPTK